MSRLRQTRPPLTLAIGLATLLSAGCIFSPQEKPIINPPEQYPEINSPESLVKNLELAYKNKDFDKFQTLLANLPDAHYFFYLSPDTPAGEDHFWGYPEEARIHRRMFRPENPLPGDTPVPPPEWPQSGTITLSSRAPFTH